MLQMTKPLLAILLLLPLSVGAGELDGKAISCASPRDGSIFFEFIDRTAKEWLLIEQEAQMQLVFRKNPPPSAYQLSPREIKWDGIGYYYFSLDRASLQLKGKSLLKGDPEKFWSCEVYTSLTEFTAMLQALKLDKQREIDEQMKDNKI